MNSVFKTVAPIAMTITFALSGVAMADTATPAAKDADATATAPATETTKPVVHHHKHKAKTEETTKNTETTTVEKSAITTPAATDKATPPVTEAGKKMEPVKAK